MDIHARKNYADELLGMIEKRLNHHFLQKLHKCSTEEELRALDNFTEEQIRIWNLACCEAIERAEIVLNMILCNKKVRTLFTKGLLTSIHNYLKIVSEIDEVNPAIKQAVHAYLATRFALRKNNPRPKR